MARTPSERNRKPARVATPPVELRARRLLALILCGIAFLAYINSLGLGLAVDAHSLVEMDARVRSLTASNVGLIFSKHYWYPRASDLLYRPVTTLSFLFNYAILGNGESPAGYHWLNLLLHLGNTLLVFALGLRLFSRKEPAFFAAALWTVHPVGVDCVTNVAGRADLLAALSLLGGLLLYARLEGRPGRKFLLALFAIALAGAFSKENAATLAGLMLLWDVAFAGGNVRELAARRWPAYAVAVAAVALLFVARALVFHAAPYPQLSLVDNPLRGAGFWAARFTAVKVAGMELLLLVWPAALSFDRSYNQIAIAGFSDWAAWLSLAALAALFGAAVARRRGDPVSFWAAGFFGISLLPASNLLMVIGATMGERFLYVPSVGFAVAVSAWAFRLLPKPRAAYWVLGALVVLLAGRTMARNPAWDSDYSLSSADVQTAPRSFRTHEMLGRALFGLSRQTNIDRAIQEGETAMAIQRGLPPADVLEETPAYLGMYYGVKGELLGGAGKPEARPWFDKALAILQYGRTVADAHGAALDAAQIAHGKPLSVRAGTTQLYLNLGAAQAALGSPAEALASYREAQRLNASAPDVYDSLASYYAPQGDMGNAAIVLLEKTQVDGYKPATMSALGRVYSAIPDGGCAVVQQGGELKLDPNCPRLKRDLCSAWEELAHAYVANRTPEKVREFNKNGVEFGCPAAPFASAP